jgi:hypothetical protein
MVPRMPRNGRTLFVTQQSYDNSFHIRTSKIMNSHEYLLVDTDVQGEI